ncbi:MAG: hypothetical protein ABL888_07045 [Pirellulaceae bacterium]
MERKVQICPAALDDIEAILSRLESRTAFLRHLLKLKYWCSGDDQVIDLEVVWDENGFWELCIDEQFGFCCGYRVEFFEEEFNGQIWIVNVRRDDEELSQRMVSTVNARIDIVDGFLKQQL